jgi:hypothetical protein
VEPPRKWPSIQESIERARQDIIWDYTESISPLDLTDEEWAVHMAEVYAFIEESPEREELLAPAEKLRARHAQPGGEG